ncbi:MAG: Stage sporulation protein [Verrucomicrobiales bacterium]|nr:Stage sporulation protein [Verrucomicrobiales bacterium]
MFVIDQLKKGDSALQKIALMILCAMIILAVRLWIVQVVSFRKYVNSHENQSFRTVRIPAVRGRILDRNGVSLAENRANYTVSLYLDELRAKFQQEYTNIYPTEKVTNAAPLWKFWDRSKTVVTRKVKLDKAQREELTLRARYGVATAIASKVSAQIGQPVVLEPQKFHQHYEKRRILPFPLTTNLNSTQIARFEEQPLNASGLDLEMQPTRTYPANQAGAHLLGYLVRNNDSQEDEKSNFDYRLIDFKGEIGIEGEFDEQLHGRAGEKWVTVNRLGYRQHESIEKPAEAGRNVVLTIDLTLQIEAEKALRTSSLGPEARAAAVVMNVNNGDILAMASNPTFDPNAYIRGMSSNEMYHLLDEVQMPQYNRPVQGIYSPGSIFKIVSGLAALEGGLNPNELYHVQLDPSRAPKGCIYVGGRKIDDTAPAGDYDFRLAFAESSNSYFIDRGLHVGVRQIIDMGNRFFLGQSTGLPVGIRTQRGRFPTIEGITKNRWTDGDTANLCIGQGPVAVTPVQMAVMTSAIANGGKIYKPRIVQRIEPQEKIPNGDEVEEFPTELRGDLKVRPANLQIVRDAMLADTEDPKGSGYKAFHKEGQRRLNDFKVCGKTGTAEILTRGVKDKITWFVSYAPYENPRYAVIIMIESGGSGGVTCAPVAEQIYRKIEDQESRARGSGQVAGL